MNKATLNAKSKLIRKNKLQVITSHVFRKNIFKIKMKNTPLILVNSTNKLLEKKVKTISCSSINMYKTYFFNNKINVTTDHKKAILYDIKNENIKNNISEFKKVAIVFFDLYNQKQTEYLSKKEENLFSLLKSVEDKINNIADFRRMKVENIFTEEFVFYIKANL